MSALAGFLGGAVTNMSNQFDASRQSKRETAKATTIAKYRASLVSQEKQRQEGVQDERLTAQNTRQDERLLDQRSLDEARHARGLGEARDTRAANREDFLWKQQNTAKKPDTSLRIAYGKLANDLAGQLQNGEIDKQAYDARISQARVDFGLEAQAPAGAGRQAIDPAAVEAMMKGGAAPAQEAQPLSKDVGDLAVSEAQPRADAYRLITGEDAPEGYLSGIKQKAIDVESQRKQKKVDTATRLKKQQVGGKAVESVWNWAEASKGMSKDMQLKMLRAMRTKTYGGDKTQVEKLIRQLEGK